MTVRRPAPSTCVKYSLRNARGSSSPPKSRLHCRICAELCSSFSGRPVHVRLRLVHFRWPVALAVLLSLIVEHGYHFRSLLQHHAPEVPTCDVVMRHRSGNVFIWSHSALGSKYAGDQLCLPYINIRRINERGVRIAVSLKLR